MALDCPNCWKCQGPTDPVFATQRNGGTLKAWYCAACHEWMAPVYRERLWTRDEWDNNDKPDQLGG